MRIRHRVAIALAGVGLVVLGTAPAQAQPAGDDEGPVVMEDPAAAFQTDVRLIAAKTGWTLPATAAHLKTQQIFGALLTKVGTAGTFAAAVFAEQPGAASLIRFAGPVPPAARAAVAEAGIPVDLQGGAKYTQKQLRERAQAVTDYLNGQGWPDVVAAVMPAGFVEVTIGGDATAKPVLPPALRDDVRITAMAGPSGQEEHTRGGAWAYGTVSGEACTTGFTVVDGAGTTGVATAAHCTGLNKYDPPDGSADYDMPFVAEHLGMFGDMEWHTSTHIEPNEFYATATSIRTVTSVEPWVAIAVNNWYCVYGRSSNNRQCDDVYSTWVSVGSVQSLIAMRNDNTIKGDSGGGWSFGNKAVGIHRGDKWIWFGSRNVWSVADLLPVALGVTVQQ
jgi:streptogrisin C